MSFVSGGAQTLTSSINPNPKHVVRIEDEDGIVWWSSSTELSLMYVDANDWSTVTSGPASTSVSGGLSVIGSPRSFGDLTIPQHRWTIWPTVYQQSLRMNVVQLSGDGDTPVFASTTYQGAIDANQTVKAMYPMNDGLAVWMQDTGTSNYSLKFFGYPEDDFVTVDADIDTTTTQSNVQVVGVTFGSEAVMHANRSTVYTAIKEDSTTFRLATVSPSISGGTIGFSIDADIALFSDTW